MKYNVSVAGKAAEADITLDGKGAFTGVISHTAFGDGQISGAEQGNTLSGTLDLGGHSAKFEATISGTSIAGVITPQGFAAMLYGPEPFTGAEAT